jgi:serine/threonine-protein kinase RsbW
MLRVISDLNNLNAIRDFVESHAAALGMTSADVYGLVLAVDEAATNICVHGYKEKPGMIEVAVEHDEQNITIRIRDEAPIFDPASIPPPNLAGTLEERALGGMGIHFMRHYTDEMIHRVTSTQGNELILKKSIRGDKQP